MPPTKKSFFDLTLQLSRVVQNTYWGEATATSSSSDDNIVTDTDNNQLAGYYADSVYQGTLWLPEQYASPPATTTVGTFHVITTHTLNTFTISPAANVAPADNEDYYAAPPYFPLTILKQSVNRALRDAGKIEMIASVTATANQEVYTSTDNAAFGEEVVQVLMAHTTTSTDPQEYTEMFGWDQEEDRTFRFRKNSIPAAAYPLRVIYKAYSTDLVDSDDEINDILNPEYIVWLAAVHALRWKVQQTKYDDQAYIQMLNEAQVKAASLGLDHRQKQKQKIPVSRW